MNKAYKENRRTWEGIMLTSKRLTEPGRPSRYRKWLWAARIGPITASTRLFTTTSRPPLTLLFGMEIHVSSGGNEATQLYSAQSIGISGVTPSLHHTPWRTKTYVQDLKNYNSYSQQFYDIKHRMIGFACNSGDSTHSLLDTTSSCTRIL
jgi:hypothetical protein